MTRLVAHLGRSITALVLVETVQVIATTLALAWVYAGQILPPYAFFPTQLYDYVAKLRFAADDLLGWLPALPDSFRPTGASAHLAVIADLLPAAIATAIVLGTLGALLGVIVGDRRLGSVRAYIVL